MIAMISRRARALSGRIDRLLIGSTPLPVDDDRSLETDPLGWAPALAFVSGVALMMMAHAAGLQSDGTPDPVRLYLLAIAITLLPICGRLAWPDTSRTERIALVLIATTALFGAKMIREPVAFIDHDTILHWLTAEQMLEQQTLFTPNVLLPVSPLFPGLEILATALVNLTGISVFWAAALLAAVQRLVFMLALFLVYERITGSSLVAGLGTMIYAGSSSFFIFNVSFSYEGLAVSLMAVLMLMVLDSSRQNRLGTIGALVLIFALALAISVTHHMTAFVAAALMMGLAALTFMQSSAQPDRRRVAALAALAAAAVAAWPAMRGGSINDYLGPILDSGLQEVLRMVTGFAPSSGRVPFEASDGAMLPRWQVYITLASVVAIAYGLTLGFLRALKHAGADISLDLAKLRLRLFSYRNSGLVLLAFVTLLWPVSILLRLTSQGWEIGNRIGPFSFLGVGIIAAIGLMSAPRARLASVPRAAAAGLACTVIVLGGIISSGGDAILPRMKYRPAADAMSMEPAGIRAAEWARDWLGPGNRFVSDRVNTLLLAAYGRQQLVTPLYDRIEAGPMLLLSETFGRSERSVIEEHDVAFVLSDLRLTTDLPAYGFYMNPESDIDSEHLLPLDPAVLLKFNDMAFIARPFDNGYIHIFDMRGLGHDP